MGQSNQNPDATQSTPKDPPTGSLPGVQRGSRLVSAWSKMLLAHVNVWDGVWSKLKSGNYEMKDWYQAIAQSVDLATAGADELMQIVAGGPQAAPWVSFKWPAKETQSVRPRLAVDGKELLRTPFALSKLGASNGTPAQAYASWEGSTLVVSIEDVYPASGEYIGFVFCDKYAEPLAIITLYVP